MKINRNLLMTFFVCIGWTGQLYGQEIIELDEQAIKRLGIEYTAVKTIDNRSGAKFPATTMNSPLASSELVTLYGGVLESWLVEPGESISKGDVLAKISSPLLLDLQNQWLASEFQRQQLAFELEKDETLLAEGVIAKQRFMQTQRIYQQALATARMLEGKLALAGFNQEALQNLLEDNNSPGTYLLRSPVDGTLSHLAIVAGSYIEANTSLASISSPRLWLTAQLPARIGNSLQLGQVLSVEGSAASLFLKQKDFEVDEHTQTVGIYAEFSGATNLLPGQVVFLLVPPGVEGVLIPGDAVVHSGDETTVYVRTNNGFEVRPVNLMPAGSDYLAESGVVVGEQLVIRGSAILKGMQLGLGGE